MQRRWLWLPALLLPLVLIPAIGDRYVIYLASEILIFMLFAVSLNLLLGYGGLVSFGHAAYFAIGAYVCAILLTKYQMPFVVAFGSAVAASALAAFVIGAFCVRLSKIYFAMLTLAFAQFVWAIAFKWIDMTGGDTGLIGVKVPGLLTEPTNFYLFAVVIVAGSMAILWVIVNSAFGRVLVATRENATRAEFVGVDVRRMQLLAFVISGTFTGVAGALFCLFNRSVYVETAYWTQSAEVLIMAVLGGIHSFIGPALGAGALILLHRITEEFTEYWPTVLAVILLLVLFALPNGLIGLRQRLRHIRFRPERKNA